jgi:FixJ family two-component response regulator
VLPVIVMTAWGTVGLAVEAMRRGARDFVQKPWENERLLSIVKTQIDLSNAHPPRACGWRRRTGCCAPKAFRR